MKPLSLRTLLPALLVGLSSVPVFASSSVVERHIPTPTGLSESLSKLIESRTVDTSKSATAIPETTEQWIELQKQFDVQGIEVAMKSVERLGISVEKQVFAGVETFFITPNSVSPEYKDKWMMHIHGGAFVFGGDEAALREAIWVANGLGAKVVSINYRKPPLYPFPAALEDTVSVWKELIKTQNPEETAILGTSAGGNLTLATTLKLLEKDLPLPGALFVGTPAVDLKETSDSWYVLEGLDPLGKRDGLLQATFDLYAGEHNLKNPLISPIYAEITFFPPTIFMTGTRDLLLSDTVRMHRLLRSADIKSELHVYDGQSHGDYLLGLSADVPESEDAIKEIRQFFNRYIN
ncbi:alpha/beta hydrolase [Marinobacter hydrocarbonoclasticus]|nr:alpha/beta hydrolase [Marinobacter nauticus]